MLAPTYANVRKDIGFGKAPLIRQHNSQCLHFSRILADHQFPDRQTSNPLRFLAFSTPVSLFNLITLSIRAFSAATLWVLNPKNERLGSSVHLPFRFDACHEIWLLSQTAHARVGCEGSELTRRQGKLSEIPYLPYLQVKA